MNEIITFGKGYSLNPGIRVFVNTAKKYCDKLTIICSNLSSDLKDYLDQNGVNIVDADSLALKHNVQTSISPYTLKVIFFYIYCKHYCNNKRVYLCDFTDLYFQEDLFKLIKSPKPYVTSENFLIENCETNTTWINICYNKDIYNLLKKYEIVNGGSILGEIAGVTELLKEMCADMTQIISRIGNYQNIDQASLNKVVYFDLERYNILNNLEIVNLAHLEKSLIEIKDNKVKVNNHEPCVIHQYDVKKDLEAYLYKTYIN